MAPIFTPPTVNEFTSLSIICHRTVPENVGSVRIFNPDGVMVGSDFYSVLNVTREFAGTYSCVVLSLVSNATKATTAEVIIRCKLMLIIKQVYVHAINQVCIHSVSIELNVHPLSFLIYVRHFHKLLDAPEITPTNVSSHQVFLGAELHLICTYVGVPVPHLQWLHNNSILTSQAGVTILGDQQGNTTSSVVIAVVTRDSGGTYTCRANNSLGNDEFAYTVLIVGKKF